MRAMADTFFTIKQKMTKTIMAEHLFDVMTDLLKFDEVV
jgi:hypothetical protein